MALTTSSQAPNSLCESAMDFLVVAVGLSVTHALRLAARRCLMLLGLEKNLHGRNLVIEEYYLFCFVLFCGKLWLYIDLVALSMSCCCYPYNGVHISLSIVPTHIGFEISTNSRSLCF